MTEISNRVNAIGEEVFNEKYSRLYERFTPEQIELIWAGISRGCYMSPVLFADISPKIMRIILDDMIYHKLNTANDPNEAEILNDEKFKADREYYYYFYYMIGRKYYKDGDVDLVKKILRYGKKFFFDYGEFELSREEILSVLKIVNDEYYKKRNGQENLFDYYREKPLFVVKKIRHGNTG